MMTNNDRMEALRKASPEVVDVYVSLETSRLLGPIRKKYQLSDIFIDIVGDYILGFIKKEALESALVEQLHISPTTASTVIVELRPLFAKLSNDPLVTSEFQTRDRLELRPKEGTTPAPATDDTVRPLTHEELMNALASRRTMASDIEAVRQKREEAKAQKNDTEQKNSPH